MGQVYILLVFIVYPRAPLRGLEVDIRHLAFADGFPKHCALIMAQVYAMDMTTGVLTFHVFALRERCQAEKVEKQDKRNTFHVAKTHNIRNLQTKLFLWVILAGVDALYPLLPANLTPPCRPPKAYYHPESHPNENYQDNDEDCNENIKILFHS